MDLASVFSRGNKLFAAICTLIILIGFGISIMLSRLSTASDQIRVEQIRIVEFKSKLNQIPGSIDTLLLQQQFQGIGPVDLNAARQVNILESSNMDRAIRIDWNLVDQYFQSARREIKAISLQNFDEAIQIRNNRAAPQFGALSANIAQANRQLGQEAGKFRQRSQLIRNLAFLGAGLLILGLILGFHQITLASAQKEHEHHQREISGMRFAALVQNSTDVIALTSRKGIVTLVNDASQVAWSVTPRDCIGKSIFDVFEAVDTTELHQTFDRALENPAHDFESSIRIEVRPGETHFFQVHVRNHLSNVHIGGLVFTFHDITERAAIQAALTHEATHDRLTGLPNRSQVTARLTEALKNAKANGTRIGALFIDLDNFKTINDTLGHEMGDLLLVKMAKRIEQAIRPSDIAARLGGDEFVIVLENVSDLDSGETVAKRLGEQFSHPFQLGSEEMIVTASIGIALSDETDETPDDILRKADAAMYQAKRHGKSGYKNFDPSMKMQADRVDNLDADLRDAVKENRLELLYQPIVSTQDRMAQGVEVLLRWQHPTRGIIPPHKFVPMLEEQGSLTTVGTQTLSEVCRRLQEWSDPNFGLQNLTVSINLAHQQFAIPEYVNSVAAQLKEHHVDPSRLQFEITESDLMIDLSLSRTVCLELRNLGISLSIDDFGTTRGSMDYITNFPVIALKVDRAITSQLGDDESAGRIFQSIVDIAHSQRIAVIGEGIESEEQFELLKAMNCDLAQGFLFGKPMSAEELTASMKSTGLSGSGQIL